MNDIPSPATKLRIYFSAYDPRERPVPLAYACGLGENPHGSYVFIRPGALQELVDEASRYFERAPTSDDADLVVYPHLYWDSPAAREVEEQARQQGLPCVFFRNSDRPPPAALRHGIVLQETIYASRRAPCEEPHPAVIDDLLADRELKLRPYSPRPTVSFRGYRGRGPLKELLWRLRHPTDRFSGAALRHRAIRQCRRSPLLETRFELTRFTQAPAEQQALRERYIENIVDSDYVLCTRGAGNWSYRLYETLCLGRIPVFFNTDCLLPAADAIDWQKQCVWLEPRDFPRVAHRIQEFHESLTPEAYADLQLSNRRLWETFLAPVAFWRRALSEIVQRKVICTA